MCSADINGLAILFARSAQRAVVAMIFLVSANYSALLGPMTWIIPPEYFNTAVRVRLYPAAAAPFANLTLMNDSTGQGQRSRAGHPLFHLARHQ